MINIKTFTKDEIDSEYHRVDEMNVTKSIIYDHNEWLEIINNTFSYWSIQIQNNQRWRDRLETNLKTN